MKLSKRLVNTRALKSLRGLQEAAMPDTGRILRRTLADDGEGGKKATYADGATTLYRLAPVSAGRDRLKAGRVAAEQEWYLTVPFETGLLDTDRFRAADGRVFEVVSSASTGSYATAQRVIVKQV